MILKALFVSLTLAEARANAETGRWGGRGRQARQKEGEAVGGGGRGGGITPLPPLRQLKLSTVVHLRYIIHFSLLPYD